MRFGLVGYGAWGRSHAQCIAESSAAELAAVCCNSDESAARAKADYPEARVFRDYRDLVQAAAVDVVAPNHLHAAIGIAALEAGKDVLLKKPIASPYVWKQSAQRRREE